MIPFILYGVLCALVFAWGRDIYGVPGAVAAAALTALLLSMSAHLATPDAIAATLLFASLYATTRCFLDPSLQAALIAGLAFGATQLTRHTAAHLYPPAILVLGVRVATAQRTESRLRVLHAGAVSLLVAASIAVCVMIVASALQSSDLLHTVGGTQAEERPAAAVVSPGDAVRAQRGPTRRGLVALPLLVLLAMRPWRRERRYTDLVLAVLAAWSLIGLGKMFSDGIVSACPFLALLAAANWDYARSEDARMAANLLWALEGVSALVWRFW